MVPTFVCCKDGKYYQDLVYQDFPQRRAWFICFDEKEPAELVVREDAWREMGPIEILKHRGFESCLRGLAPGRREPHPRFFGREQMQESKTDVGLKPITGYPAVSWWLILKKDMPLPTPNQYDSCVESFPYFPNVNGVYFGHRS